MNNFGFQRERKGGGTIANNAAIEFNNQIVNYNSNIEYNASTFSLKATGDYYVFWTVTIKTGLGVKGPTISLITDDDTVYDSTNSMKTGQISGSAVIRVNGAKTFQLINKTGQSIVLADNVDVSATISIVQLSEETAGIDLKLINSPGVDLAGGATVPFDTEFAKFNNMITNAAGVISITNAGKYIIDWSVAIDGSLDAVSSKFVLVHPTSETENTILGTSEISIVHRTSIYGSAILNVTTASQDVPYNIELINGCTDAANNLVEITLADISTQASIRIVQI